MTAGTRSVREIHERAKACRNAPTETPKTMLQGGAAAAATLRPATALPQWIGWQAARERALDAEATRALAEVL